MNPDLLKLAKQYQKEHKWKKAIECLEQYMKENNGSCDDTVFVSYARSLRIIGQSTFAKEALVKGRKQHPHSERILLEFHNLYDFLGDWNAAKIVANNLIKLNPKKADYHFRLGRSYSFLLEYRKAKKAYQIGLEQKHGLSFGELIEKIQSAFAENPAEVTSKYIFIDGKNNLGAFIHRYKNKKYFTKISYFTKKNIGAGREETFYKNLCEDFPALKHFTPQYIDSQIIDRISYLTIEMVDSIETTSEHIKKVIESSQKISTINYQSLINNYPIPDYVFQFKRGRAISVVHFFTQIHEKTYNQKMFEALHLIIKQQHYPKASSQIMHRLESTIMTNQLYTLIEPEKHYSLLHGDFAFQNVMIHKDDQSPRIIDWTSYTTGPHFIDIVRYFTSLLLPYSEVKELYIHDPRTGGKLTMIEHIFFLYSLILFYFQKLGRKGIETEISVFILPALEDLEKLVVKYKKSIEGDQLIVEQQPVLKDMEEKELKIKQLEQRVSILEEERKHLHQRLEDVLNSKSWKITSPLRLYTERLAKKE